MENELCEKLYRTYYLRVYSYLLSLSSNPSLAEELTGETFYRVFKTKADFKGDASAGTWLCAIAKNLYFDEMKKRKRQTDLPDEIEADTGPETDILERETSFRIHTALHELEEPYKEVFELRAFGDLSFAEIGTIFKKTESWARVTYHRARLKIRERMENT